MATETLTARVARGAKLLDRQRPGWAREIDPDNLRMASADRCVLGQLYGNYVDGVKAVGAMRPKGHDSDVTGKPVAFGFHLPRWPDREDPFTETWDALADAWRAEVQERVAA